MTLRSARERVFQTISYEVGGLLIAAPLYALVFGAEAQESLLLIAAVSAAVLLWSPIHNTAFDWAEFRLSGRLASDRPHRWRVVHAISHEASSVVVSLPVIIWLGDHGFWEALLVDIGLTLVYTLYAYLFHIAYDWLRPVRAPAAEGALGSPAE